MINFYSIQHESVHEIIIRKSRFITYLLPITSEEEFINHLQKIKKDHYKATHHCTAYILGNDSQIQKANDDGEPSGTAGYPMLEVLQKNQLTNIMAVVVRYFGGIKLGTGGLIRAYSSSVSEALNHSQLIANVNQDIIQVGMDYRHIDSFNYLHETGPIEFSILATEYTDKVSYDIAIDPELSASLAETLQDRFNGEILWQQVDSRNINLPIQKP